MPAGGSERRAPDRSALLAFGLLLALVTPRVCAAPVCAPDRIDEQVRVKWVMDGDTVHLTDGRVLRLIGVDTPELGRDGAPAQPLALDARDRLRLFLAQHHNTLNLRYDEERTDRYGRLLAHAFIQDGSSVSAWLQRQGLGTVLVVPPNQWNYRCYAAAEQDARSARRGVWVLPTHQIIDAARVTPGRQGYLLTRGRITRSERHGNALWLYLDERVVLQIDGRDLRYFGDLHPESLHGRSVTARGMVHARDGRSYMWIRHPAGLQLSGH